MRVHQARSTRPPGLALAALLLLTVPAGAQEVTARASAQATVESPVPALLKPEVLLSVGRLVEPDLDPPEVLGSEKEGMVEDRSLTVFDRIYVPRVVEGRALAIDDRVRTFRIRERVVDPVTGTPVGRILAPTGVAVIDSLAGEVAVARIEHAFAPVLVGDGVERVSLADTVPAVEGLVAGETGYVLAFQAEHGLQPPYEVVFLRLASPGALAPGAAVEVYRPGERRAGRRLPDVRVGKAMVVRVDGDVATSILYDLRRSDIEAGQPFRSVVPEP